ncbi:MAG: dehydrogenase, partial [Cyclobacteriaceae bacterium]|nr:dehydrogenase [Cyclobacteriaceae bacterium]
MYIFLLTAMVQCHDTSPPSQPGAGPLSPEESLPYFETEPGFKIELLAAEPLLADPVDMEIDEYGRLYVVEMPGYPIDKNHTGRIKLLSDSDGDGRMDRVTLFAEGLVLPNGILRWKKGVLVTDAPHVLYLEDTDEDGRADKIDTVLTGFSLSNPHINVNNPVYGIDNWIYLGHRGEISTRKYQEEFGDKGSEIYFPGYPDSPRLPRNAHGRTVRFKPGGQQLEITASRTQFGQAFDTWGHHLLVDNSNHVYQEVMAARYLQRATGLAFSEATQSLSDHGNAAEIYQITDVPERQLFSPPGMMTSCSGLTAYLGGAFPSPFQENIIFVAESVSNLIHADRLTEKGATFVASRVGRAGKEFLASRDAWFRPVNMYVGPDGALYVIDYYREIIEHPEWMSDEAVAAGNLENGKDMGRIYRISAENSPPPDWTKGLSLGDMTDNDLIATLDHPNAWYRLNAQRLLVDRNNPETVPLLSDLAGNKQATAPGRLHALWTLEGMERITTPLLQQALQDSEAGVRENAIKLTEKHLKEFPGLITDLLALQDDPAPKVRFQLLCTLGDPETPEAALVRNRLLFQDVGDPWVQIAALSAPSTDPSALLPIVIDHFHENTTAYSALADKITAMIGAKGNKGEIQHLLERATTSRDTSHAVWQSAILQGLATSLKRNKDAMPFFKEKQSLLLQTCFQHPSPDVRDACMALLETTGLGEEAGINRYLARAVQAASDKNLRVQSRVEGIRFIKLAGPAPYDSLLKSFLAINEPVDVQLRALEALNKAGDLSLCTHLLERWPSMAPKVRDAALNIFLENLERTTLLLEALEKEVVQKSLLGWGREVQLMNHADENTRDRARALLRPAGEETAAKDMEKILRLEGEVNKGSVVFEQNCAQCHQVKGQSGTAYG